MLLEQLVQRSLLLTTMTGIPRQMFVTLIESVFRRAAQTAAQAVVQGPQ